MSQYEWPATDYSIGSYIQAIVADQYLPQLAMNSSDTVLDIGCGNGAYSLKLLKLIPHGSLLGIDTSNNMLQLAQELARNNSKFTVKNCDVCSMTFTEQFDYIVSFWCLQWCKDIRLAFVNMIKALKDGGRFFALFPAGNDPFINTYYALKESKRFASLERFTPPIDYSQFNNLQQQLKLIPCHSLQVNVVHETITLPSLDIFRKFVNGIAFYQGQLEIEDINMINEAMVEYYAKNCMGNTPGSYPFSFTLYLVTGHK